jgi:hypothetical protein
MPIGKSKMATINNDNLKLSLQWKTMEIFHFLPTRQVNSQAYDITANTPYQSQFLFVMFNLR